MKSWPPDTFQAGFNAWCRGCNDDIFEGDEAGFIPGEKGIHCFDCVREAFMDTACWEPMDKED